MASASESTNVVYTDGADTGQQAAGVGVYFGPKHALNISRRVFGQDTNNRAEMEAILDAVIIIRSAFPGQPWVIKTDRRFSRDSITKWWPGWHRKGGRTATGKPAVHYSLSIRIARLLDGQQIVIEWIPREKNNGADALAKAAKELKKMSPPCGHPLFVNLADNIILSDDDRRWADEKLFSSA